MRIAEQAQGQDLVEVLIGESGKFIATSPDGGTFVVTCSPRHSLTSLQNLSRGSSEEFGVSPIAGVWNVKKIASVQLPSPQSLGGAQSLLQDQQYSTQGGQQYSTQGGHGGSGSGSSQGNRSGQRDQQFDQQQTGERRYSQQSPQESSPQQR